MYKNHYLEEAINNNNIVRIKSAFTMIAHEDRSFSSGKFKEALNYVKAKNIDGLFEKYDNRPFEVRDNWNEDYWALIVSSLVSNFCQERIDHLEEISKVIYPKKETSTGPKNTKKPQKKREQIEGMEAITVIGTGATAVLAMVMGAKKIAAVASVLAITSVITVINKSKKN